MNQNNSAALWALVLTFGALLILFVAYASQHARGTRESEEIYAERTAISAAFEKAYHKLMLGKTNTVAAEPILISPDEVRQALAREGELVAVLPAADRLVYVASSPVPLASGKFVCFVYLGRRIVPYGLTSDGQCRYAKGRELRREDFAGLDLTALVPSLNIDK